MKTFIFCWLDRLIITEALHLLAGHHWHLRCDVVSSNVLSKACAQAPGFRGFFTNHGFCRKKHQQRMDLHYSC